MTCFGSWNVGTVKSLPGLSETCTNQVVAPSARAWSETGFDGADLRPEPDEAALTPGTKYSSGSERINACCYEPSFGMFVMQQCGTNSCLIRRAGLVQPGISKHGG